MRGKGLGTRLTRPFLLVRAVNNIAMKVTESEWWRALWTSRKEVSLEHAQPTRTSWWEMVRKVWFLVACSQKVVRTNEIVRWWLFHSTSLTTMTFVITNWVSIPFLTRFKLVQISVNVARLHLQNCALAHWFTRPFLLVRGKGLGTRLMRDYLSKLWRFSIKPISKNSEKTTINLQHVNLIIFSV